MRGKYSDAQSRVERIIVAVMLTVTLWLFTSNRLSSSIDVTGQSALAVWGTEQL